VNNSALVWYLLIAAAALPASASAQTAPSPALPRSIEIRVSGAYVRTSPSAQGSRRGTLALGARLRPEEVGSGSGCESPWYRIGPEAWVCGRYVVRSDEPPEATQLPSLADGSNVPGIYGFAGVDGARVYATMEQATDEDWDREFDPRSGLHLRERTKIDGRPFYRLVSGGFIAASDVIPARPSTYSGVELGETDAPAGFVGRRRVAVRARPGGGKRLHDLGKRTPFRVLEEVLKGRTRWLRIAEDQWIASKQLRLVEPQDPPPAVGPTERWIDVDRSKQIVTAYEGPRPVFATLASTGRRGSATPRGTFRIWAKIATGSMSDDGGDDIDSRPYLMQGVPWIMYFNEGVALHGAYWHNDFGRERSHGCVNLAPRDARRFFEWASPSLPPGWTGVLPTRSEPGTLVVVR